MLTILKRPWTLQITLRVTQKNSTTDYLIIEGNSCNDEKITDDYFNEFFTIIGSNFGRNFSEDDVFLSCLNISVVSTFMFDAFTLDQLEKVIISFKNSSPGLGNLCMTVYKDNLDVLSKTLLLICNQSLMQEKFSSNLKIAKISTVFKSSQARLLIIGRSLFSLLSVNFSIK